MVSGRCLIVPRRCVRRVSASFQVVSRLCKMGSGRCQRVSVISQVESGMYQEDFRWCQSGLNWC